MIELPLDMDDAGIGGIGNWLEMSMTSYSSEELGLGCRAGIRVISEDARIGLLTGDGDLESKTGRETNVRDFFLVYNNRIESVRVISRNLLLRRVDEDCDLIESEEELETL